MGEENQKKKVVLTLAGIDKRWVRSESGRWVDEATVLVAIDNNIQDETVEDKQSSKKRWWQIFKKH